MAKNFRELEAKMSPESHKRVAEKVAKLRKEIAAKKAKKKPREDFSQAAARIVKQATEGY